MYLTNLIRRKSPVCMVYMTKAEKVKTGLLIFAGKILGVILVLMAMKIIPGFFGTPAYADEVFTSHETSLINSVNTVWTLVAAFLVFGMQAGFVMLEAGFAQKKIGRAHV